MEDFVHVLDEFDENLKNGYLDPWADPLNGDYYYMRIIAGYWIMRCLPYLSKRISKTFLVMLVLYLIPTGYRLHPRRGKPINSI